MKVCADNHYLISCIRIKCSVCILETDVRWISRQASSCLWKTSVKDKRYSCCISASRYIIKYQLQVILPPESAVSVHLLYTLMRYFEIHCVCALADGL
jgi:hypothetical protein